MKPALERVHVWVPKTTRTEPAEVVLRYTVNGEDWARVRVFNRATKQWHERIIHVGDIAAYPSKG